MKLITLGKIDKKFFLYIFLTVIVETLSALINKYFDNNKDDQLNNTIMTNKIIEYGSFPFYGIFEYILNKRGASNPKKINSQNKEIITQSTVNYIVKLPEKAITRKNLLFTLIFLFSYFIYSILCDIFFGTYLELARYGTGEYYNALDLFYLYILTKIIHKTNFYRHHNLSIFILIVILLLNYFIKLYQFKNNGDTFDFPDDLVCFIPLIIFPIFDSYRNYFSKYIMMHYYFSPFLFCFVMGVMYIFLSIILLIIFLNIDCGNSAICQTISEIEKISVYAIILYIFKSILLSLNVFFTLLVMNDFTLLHIIVLFIFIRLVNNIFELFDNFTYYQLIINIITFAIEIFFLFVLFEIIELNFCGLNHNLRMNIITRSESEIKLIYQDGEDVNSNNESIEELKLAPEENDDDNYF